MKRRSRAVGRKPRLGKRNHLPFEQIAPGLSRVVLLGVATDLPRTHTPPRQQSVMEAKRPETAQNRRGVPKELARVKGPASFSPYHHPIAHCPFRPVADSLRYRSS